MTPTLQPRVVVERNALSLRALVVMGRTLKLYRECSSEDPAACRELLEAVRHAAGGAAETIALVASATQTLPQAPRGLPAASPEAELLFATVDRATGATLGTVGHSLLLGSPAAELDSLESWLVAGKFSTPSLLSSTIAELGGAAKILPVSSHARVAIWNLSGTPATLALMSPRGVDAVQPCAAGWPEVVDAVREALNLKATATVTKFLFNDLFDFTDVAPRITRALIGSIKTALAAFPTAPTAFHISGLSRRQAWLAREIATAVGMAQWQPKMSEVLQSYGLTVASDVSADSLPVSILPLLQAAVSVDGDGPWLARWQSADELPEPSSPVESPPAVATSATPFDRSSPTRVPWSSEDHATASPSVAVAQLAAPATTGYRTTALAAPLPPRATVNIGARKLMLAPLTPTVLPGRASPGHRAMAPAMPSVSTVPSEPPATVRKHAPTPVPPVPTPKAPPERIAPPAQVLPPPPRRTRSRQRVFYMAGVAVVLAAVNGFTYFNRGSDDSNPSSAADGAATDSASNVVAGALPTSESALAQLAESAPVQPAEETRSDLPAATDVTGATGPLNPVVQWQPAPLANFVAAAAEQPLSILFSNEALPWEVRPIAPANNHHQPASEPAIRTGSLRLISEAVGSTFELTDSTGNVRSIAPGLIGELSAGTYEIAVARPGWTPLRERIEITGGEVTTYSPRFSTGRLVLRTSPAGAAVTLNGILVGQTPLELNEQSPGPFALGIALSDHDEVQLGGEILAGSVTELAFTLDRLDRLARVSELVTPPVATLRIPPEFGRPANIRAGHVLLSFIIDRTGVPSEVRVEDASDRRLIRPCLNVITRWQFSPGINRDGKPVNTRVHQLFQVEWEG